MTQPAAEQRCYRHPDREAYISCQRCGRLICPACMNDASVGFQCPSCLTEGNKSVRQARTIAGGSLPTREGAVSLVLIGINVVAYLLQTATKGTDASLFQHGAMQGYAVAVGDDYWRLLTSAFLHGGILHLAFNMYALYLFGPFVERALGTVRFVVAYLTMAIFSGVFVYLLTNPETPTVGASGAVFGLFGIALVLLLRAKQDVRTLLVLLAVNAVISTQGNISWQGHLGGFIAGLILGAVFAYAPKANRTVVQALVIGAMWVFIVGAVLVRTPQLTG